MKKILAMMLTAAMMLSMGTAAMADGETVVTDPNKSAPATYTAIIKAYTVNNVEGEADVFPTETLTFTPVADATNPDTTNITIENLVVNGIDDQHLTIKIPEYSEVGTYHYTITENAGNAQGVTYTPESIYVSVLVEYDYNDEDGDGRLKTATVGVTSKNSAKDDTFTNTYELGNLSVTKNVTGNLADTSKYFKIIVTFNAEKDVESAITLNSNTLSTHVHTEECDETCAEERVNPTVIADGWTGKKEVVIYLKHGETLTFSNIPDGVTYTVVEDAAHLTGAANESEGYTATYSNANGEIEATTTIAATILNTKTTEVDTGISVDSIPYIAMLGVVAIGGTGIIVSKKRRSED